MERIGNDIRRVLGIPGLEGDPRLARIVDRWDVAVGEQVARHAWPARLARDGTLHVATSSSVWAFELTALTEVMMERLAGTLGDDTPAAVRFAPGRVPDRTVAPTATPAPAAVHPAPSKDDAAELVAAIEDDELREMARRAAAASLARERNNRSV